MTVAVALLAAFLVGCAAPAAEPSAPPASETPEAEATATPTPSARAAVFRMPTLCSEVLPASRVAHLQSLGMELLAGPEGKYGDSYLADPTPEQLAGGITCIWGEEEVPENSVIISVAPLVAATRDTVIEDLVEQGLNERVAGDALIYERVGDEVAAPAIVNVVHDDCWVSVIEGLGGADFYEEATVIADEVETQVGA
jgi:hypothetical protein